MYLNEVGIDVIGLLVRGYQGQLYSAMIIGQDILISIFLDILGPLSHSCRIGFVCLVLGGLSFQLQKLTGKLFFVNFLVLGLSQELLQNFSLVHAAGQERQCERVKGGHVKSVSWPRDIMKPLLPLEQSMLKLWFTDCITSPRGN